MTRTTLRGGSLVLALLALSARAVDAQADARTRNASARLDSTVATYCAAWGESDRAARDRMLERVWARNGTYSDPAPRYVRGRDALSAEIDRFQRDNRGTRFRCSGTQSHHGTMRFTWVMVGADGIERLQGMDFAEVDGDGRISRIVGFFGPAPNPPR